MYYSSGNYEAFAHPATARGRGGQIGLHRRHRAGRPGGRVLPHAATHGCPARDDPHPRARPACRAAPATAGIIPGAGLHHARRPRDGQPLRGDVGPVPLHTLHRGRRASSILDYYYRLNKQDPNYSLCRATVRTGARTPVLDNTFGLSDKACMEIMNLFFTPGRAARRTRPSPTTSPTTCSNSNFWLYWRTMFAFENWHCGARDEALRPPASCTMSAACPTSRALRFTRYNQYESMILPMVNYLEVPRRRLPVQHPRD